MDNKKHFGVMLDMSRNGVMKVEKVKEYVDYLVKMGYNTLQLYTEDVFEVNNEPYFGYMRGRYTKNDLKEIDAYCVSKGVELIPCVQVLAHLNAIFKWDEYIVNAHDIDDILLIGNERTYKLIENIFATIAECFTSRKVNINLDEAHHVGLGSYLGKNGYKNRFQIIREHLDKVIEISSKYGFHLMMWSDMFFKLLNKGNYYGNGEVTEEVTKYAPKEIDLIYWDYYHTDKAIFERMVDNHKKFGNKVWFAGGVWVWGGFSPYFDGTYEAMLPALKVMKEKNVDNILITLWGDDGKECSYFSALPALFRLKKEYDGVSDLDVIKREFKMATGEDFDAMSALQAPNVIFDKARWHNKDKYLFYSDIFNYYFDDSFDGSEKEKCLKTSKDLLEYAKNSKFDYIFRSQAALLKALAIKHDLGDRLEKAYKTKNKKEIKNIIKDISTLIKDVKNFYVLYRKSWYIENHPNGFDIQDIRLNGFIGRLVSCKERLVDFVKGKIDKIEELEVEKLKNCCGSFTIWARIVSTNVMTHGETF